MKTVGVTFGDGFYDDIAKRVATRFEEINGIECVVIDIDDVPPMNRATWVKAYLWDILPSDVDRFIWIDADVMPISSMMEFLPHPDVAFAGVQDLYHGGRQTAEWFCEDIKSLTYYFNMGVFIATRAFEPVLKAARAYQEKKEWSHNDQNPMNLEIAKQLKVSQVEVLPRVVNWLSGFDDRPPTDIRNLHLAGIRDEGLRFSLFHSFLRVFDVAREEAAK